MTSDATRKWLVLVHQIPAQPAYLRVKIGRRLQRIGAIALKNAVYALPPTGPALEDLQWALREVVDGGGEAVILEARLMAGTSDAEVEALFRAAREPDYRAVLDEARLLERRLDGAGANLGALRAEARVACGKLERRLADISALDFFGASSREEARTTLRALRRRFDEGQPRRPAQTVISAELAGKTWVTRADVHVDRIACAWLVHGFIDAKARFKFVDERSYQGRAGEIRFDMLDADFGHDGDECTFEVMVGRLGLSDPALRALAEVIHDIDLKDNKYGRPETAGVAAMIAGLDAAHVGDQERVDRGASLFDSLHAYFRSLHPGRRKK